MRASRHSPLRRWRVVVSRRVHIAFASWRRTFDVTFRSTWRTEWRTWPMRWRVRSPAAQRYLREARAWRAGTREVWVAPVRAVSEVAITHWWMGELDRRGEAVAPAIRAWQTASDAALERMRAGWLEAYLRSRVSCDCGLRWRVESAAFCTHCAAVLAPCCVERGRLPRWRNGNAICPRCGAGEVVG